MSRDKCILDASKLLRDLKGSAAVDELADLVEKTIDKANLEGKDIRQAVQELSEEYRKKIEWFKAQKTINILKFDENRAFLAQDAFKGKYKAGMNAVLSVDHGKTYKGHGTIERRKDKLKADVASMISQTTNKHDGLEARWNSGDIDDDIRRVILGDKGDDLSDIGADVRELAETLKKVNNHILDQKINAGFATRKLEGYIAPQRWDFDEMLKLGKDEASAKMAWKKLASETFDLDRMGLAGPERVDDYLERFWEKRKNRSSSNRFEIDDEFEQISMNIVADKAAKRRNVHFKGAAGESAYNAAVGGKTIAERVYAGVSKDAGHIAAAQQLGPNYRATWRKMLNDGANELSQADMQTLQKKFDFAVEGARQPEMNLLAKGGNLMRGITDVTKLGTAIFTTVTDFAFTAGVVSKQNGKNFYHQNFRAVKEFTKLFTDKKRMRTVAAKVGIFADDLNGSTMTNRYVDSDAGTATGTFDRFRQNYLKATGLPRQSLAMRMATVKMLSTDMHESIGKNFSELLPAMQEMFGKFGIDEVKWGYLQKAVADLEDGTFGITPDAILNLSDDVFTGMTKRQASTLKNDLANGLSGYLTDLSEIGSPTPGLQQRFWKEHTDRNTAMGQAARMIGQYKSFPLAQFKTMSHIQHTGSRGRFGDIKTTANTILSATAFGYLALAMKDVAKGREIHDPTDPATLVDAFIQSGAGLIYTDFLAGEYNKSYKSLAGDFAGPAISGPMNDFATLMAKAMRGDLKAGEILKKMERNTPAIFMSRALLNKNIYEAAHRSMNEGVGPRRSNTYQNFYSWYD